MIIKPLSNNILFQFLDEVRNGMFWDVSETSQIVIGKTRDGSADQARWGKVIEIGPDVKVSGIKPGDLILIEKLRWTEAFTVDRQKYWFTRENEVIGVQEE